MRFLENLGLGLRQIAHVLGALKEAKCARAARMDHAYRRSALQLVMTSDDNKCPRKSQLTLEVLGPIERLLFLQQKGIADEWEAAHCLAMGSVIKKSGN